jgi:uncharacterized membrane protein HdeD (DUF308 family)
MQTLTKTWWLLALAGIFDAVYSVINVFMQRPDGSLALRTFVRRGTVFDMGMLALAAGACTIAAGLWISRNRKAWFFVLNGAALSTLGLIFLFWRGPLAFRTIALLLIVMAVSAGILALAAALNLRGHVSDKWLLGLAGALAAAFALTFFVLGFGWIRLARPELLNLWMGSFFAFSAICLLGLAVRLHNLRGSALKSFGAAAPV